MNGSKLQIIKTLLQQILVNLEQIERLVEEEKQQQILNHVFTGLKDFEELAVKAEQIRGASPRPRWPKWAKGHNRKRGRPRV